MAAKQQIIPEHLNGTSNRDIARSLYVSKDTVNKYVNEYDRKRAELTAADPETDISEIIQDFVSADNNYRFSKLYMSQDTMAFQESHADYFEHCGGVYRTMVYDNMKVAAKRFVGPKEKEPTEALLQLSVYYGFSFRFCNTASGNEKGYAEGMTGCQKAWCLSEQVREI